MWKKKEMMEKEYMSKKSENYRGIYKDMVEVLGHDITLKVYENYKGQQITFPMRLYSDKYIIDYLNKNYDEKDFCRLIAIWYCHLPCKWTNSFGRKQIFG